MRAASARECHISQFWAADVKLGPKVPGLPQGRIWRNVQKVNCGGSIIPLGTELPCGWPSEFNCPNSYISSSTEQTSWIIASTLSFVTVKWASVKTKENFLKLCSVHSKRHWEVWLWSKRWWKGRRGRELQRWIKRDSKTPKRFEITDKPRGGQEPETGTQLT